MTTTRKTSRLKRSKLENLFRHANGVYDARLKVNGKSKERSLRTTDGTLAANPIRVWRLLRFTMVTSTFPPGLRIHRVQLPIAHSRAPGDNLGALVDHDLILDPAPPCAA
jgi:hypothetical protein